MAKNADLVRLGEGKTSKPKERKLPGISFRELEGIDAKKLMDVSSWDLEHQKEMVEKANKLYQKAKETLTEFTIDAADTDINPKTSPVGKLVEEFVFKIKTGDELLVKSLYSNEDNYNIVTHMLNVAILAIKLGVGLNFSDEELLGLGLAAILHDIGMRDVPKQLVCPPRKLSPVEYQEIKKHSLYGHEKIKRLGDRFTRLAEVVLNVHEREDGKGYPYGLIDGEIHDYAKIIGLVDTYEALTHNRPYRKRLFHFDAMKYIIDKEKGSFPKSILKILLQQVSTYPIKSFVKLNSGEIAQVMKINPLAPLCPVVRIICNAHRERLKTPKLIDIAKTSLLHIVCPIFKEDVSL